MKLAIVLSMLALILIGCVNELPEVGSTEAGRGSNGLIIDSYSFGSIMIDGEEYKDVKIYDGKVILWRSIKRHAVTVDDLVEIVETEPEVLVIGTGYSSQVEVDQEAEEFLRENNIDYVIENTNEAYKSYNGFVEEGKDVAAILHSTC